MKSLENVLIKILEKFDIVKIMVSAFIVLALMLVPKINYLDFLMPLDRPEKWIEFVFAIILSYIVITLIVFIGKTIRKHFIYKPKKLIRMMVQYGDYINIFYSDKINEYSPCYINLKQYNIPKEIIAKLEENRIIESLYVSDGYKLTTQARKKLIRLSKTAKFLDDKVFKHSKHKNNNEK